MSPDSVHSNAPADEDTSMRELESAPTIKEGLSFGDSGALEHAAEIARDPVTDASTAREKTHVWPALSRTRQVLLVLSMTVGMLLNIMQVQAIQLALPSLGADLGILTSDLQWLYGHKKAFILGLMWFIVWSIACAVAPNEVAIDFFRSMQGVGMGAAIPSALGILGSSFPPGQSKTMAFALFSAGAPMGGSLGAVLGGVLTEYASDSWRSIFYVSAGVAALVGVGAFYAVPPDPEKDNTLTVDWIGGALITSGLVLLTFSLADGSSAPNGWKTPYVPTLFSVSILLLVAFWFYERHLEFHTSRPPLMKTSLWFKGRFAAVQLIGALGWSCFASYMLFASLTFQDYMKLKPVLATVRFLPSSVTGLVLNIIVALLASRVPAQALILLGCLGTGLAPLLFALQNYSDPYWQWQFPAMILTDFIFACGILYVSAVAGHGQQALAGSIFNMSTQIGTGIGLAINTIVQSRVTQRKVEDLGGTYDPNAASPRRFIPARVSRALVSATCLYGIGKVGHREKKKPQGGSDGTVGSEEKV
ncbi:SPOSA6832_04614, partial [Sporobolomyces salmonicolor]